MERLHTLKGFELWSIFISLACYKHSLYKANNFSPAKEGMGLEICAQYSSFVWFPTQPTIPHFVQHVLRNVKYNN